MRQGRKAGTRPEAFVKPPPAKRAGRPADTARLSWLAEARQRGPLLTEKQPVCAVRRVIRNPGEIPLGGHLHPYCEITLSQKGYKGLQMVGAESIRRAGGTVLLLGPGLPHKTIHERFPARSLTVYFLPGILLDMGPDDEVPRLLRRLTARQPLRHRMRKPPAAVWRRLKTLLNQMIDESDHPKLGSGLRLRVLLIELLIELLRCEPDREDGLALPPTADWEPLARVLRYLHEHFAEPVYGCDLARIAGMSRSKLHHVLRENLGISWVRYLQGYRIQRAAALLVQPGYDVTRAAFEVGFNSLSHFNATFRRFYGVNPSRYPRGRNPPARPG